MKVEAQTFGTHCQFHHTIRAMVGKHIAIKKPQDAGSIFLQLQKFHSIILLALVNVEYKFIWVSIRANGGSCGATIWNDSDLTSAVKNGTLRLPPPEPLPSDT